MAGEELNIHCIVCTKYHLCVVCFIVLLIDFLSQDQASSLSVYQGCVSATYDTSVNPPLIPFLGCLAPSVEASASTRIGFLWIASYFLFCNNCKTSDCLLKNHSIMSSPPSRLKSILGHLFPSSTSTSSSTLPTTTPKAGATYAHTHHLHTLSPTAFLPRAAAIEPHAEAIIHITSNGATLRRSYQEFADRARGLAYFLQKHGLTRVGVLMTNTPAFLESIFGVVAGGGVLVPVNYRLKEGDVRYMFELGEVDLVLVDWEFEGLLGEFRKARPEVKIVVDTVSCGR